MNCIPFRISAGGASPRHVRGTRSAGGASYPEGGLEKVLGKMPIKYTPSSHAFRHDQQHNIE